MPNSEEYGQVSGRMERQMRNIDHFNDTKQEMQAVVQRRETLQRRAGRKLVHCKLKGHEDVANEFKRLINLKAEGTHYAVKAAQMKPLIAHNKPLPSKSVQRRIESVEHEIFSLLSREGNNAPQLDLNINLGNCINVMNSYYDNLMMKLDQLSRVQEGLVRDDTYTAEGFKKNDVKDMKEKKEKKHADEIQLEMLEKSLADLTAELDDNTKVLKQEEGMIKNYKASIKTTRALLARTNKDYVDVRSKVSEKRKERNDVLCKVFLQRRALNPNKESEDVELKAAQSLHTRKSDIEKEITAKAEKLKKLKKKTEELESQERSLEAQENSRQAKLDNIKAENSHLNTKIAGVRECNTIVLRDIDTCLQDVGAGLDLDCIAWRDRVIKTVFQADLMDVNAFKSVSFSNKEKYKFPSEQFQIYNALRPELAMLDCGIADLVSKMEHLKSETKALAHKNKNTSKQRNIRQQDFNKAENVVSRSQTKLARLDQLLKSTVITTSDLLERLAQLIPRTNILETIDEAHRQLILPILHRVEEAGSASDAISKYNKMKQDILDDPYRYPDAISYAFLRADGIYQYQLEEKLQSQLDSMKLDKN